MSTGRDFQSTGSNDRIAGTPPLLAQEAKMPRMNYLVIVAASVAAFVVGWLWYSPLLFGRYWVELHGLEPGAMADMTMVLCGVLDWGRALRLGFLLWIGFPVTLLVGSVIWESTSWELSAIHAGDWLMKILLMTLMLGTAHRPVRAAHPLPQPQQTKEESSCP
jgi:hypothetical protein